METCKQCGKNLLSHQKKYCGHACQGAAKVGTGTKHIQPCKICGVEVRKYNPKGKGVVCSDACLRESRRRNGKQLAADGKARPPKPTEATRKAASERMKGAGCPKWNGAKTTGGAGRYILVRAPDGYPFPDSIGTRGYIREHRMVMELHLGRALVEGEEIHHVNHDTKDNRLENLRLMTRQEHIAQERTDGTFLTRYKQCVFECGRGTKAALGRHFQACLPCRKRHPDDARSTLEYEWKLSPLSRKR
jgi:hypothetical protein